MAVLDGCRETRLCSVFGSCRLPRVALLSLYLPDHRSFHPQHRTTTVSVVWKLFLDFFSVFEKGFLTVCTIVSWNTGCKRRNKVFSTKVMCEARVPRADLNVAIELHRPVALSHDAYPICTVVDFTSETSPYLLP